MTQQFDDAVTDATATVHGNARRLVDNEQTFFLVDDMIEHRGRELCGRRRTIVIDAHGRYPQLIAFTEPMLGPNPTAVDPNLAAPDQSVQPALGYAGQFTPQEIVDTLPVVVGINPDFAHSGGAISVPFW